jgi:hypothetical protein
MIPVVELLSRFAHKKPPSPAVFAFEAWAPDRYWTTGSGGSRINRGKAWITGDSQRKRACDFSQALDFLAPEVGLEPTTP